MRERAAGKTCGLSTLPTEPAISIATPPKRCSSERRKKFGQSADSQARCGSVALPLKPSVSACCDTLASVTIARPSVPTAWSSGMTWSSTYGYDDQHWRMLAGSSVSAKRMCAGRCAM